MTLHYSSVGALTTLFPAIGSLSSVNSATLYAFMERSEAEINARIARSYTVPVTGSPPYLAGLTTEFTMYKLLTQRYFPDQQLSDSEWPDKFIRNFDKMVDGIAEGSVLLVNNSGGVIGSNTGEAPILNSAKGYTPTMSILHSTRNLQDPDKVDDLIAERDS
jgi:hypothetical protein